MAKTVKYYVGFYTYNTPFITTAISKKQYDVLLKKYTEVLKENHRINTPEETEYYIEKNTETKEHDTYIDETIEFADGPSGAILGKYTCKKGYVFT